MAERAVVPLRAFEWKVNWISGNVELFQIFEYCDDGSLEWRPAIGTFGGLMREQDLRHD